MPELPEVETVRAQLDPVVVGRTIRTVSIGDFRNVVASTIPDTSFEKAVIGQTINGTGRRGKYLILKLTSGKHLIVHLRMTGRFLILPRDAEEVRFQHLALHLDNSTDLRFADQRKFGRVVVTDSVGIADLDRKLGPEPWDLIVTGKWLAQRLANRTGPIKNALLDQHLIAGLGNIYVDEALYMSRINPLQAARLLTEKECSLLIRAFRQILGAAIARQGTTFSTFSNPYGEPGQNANFLKAYGKGGSGTRCARCGSIFERTVVAGRGTSFCPGCQPLRT